MGMSVTFYNCSDDDNVVNKVNKTVVNTFTCDVYDDQDKENPILLLPSTLSGSANYCYIPTFGRYYFCKPTQLSDGRVVAECGVDALSSFWNDFKSSQCIANRSASNYNREITDDLVLIEPTVNVEELPMSVSSPFTNGLDGNDYNVVMTLGGR